RAQSNSSIVEQFAVTSPAILQSLLQKGQLIFIDNAKPGEPQFVTVITLFDAPIDKVFSTITDYDHYVGNIPQTTEVRVTKKQGNTWFVSYKIMFKFSIIVEHANYTLKQVLDPPKSITWSRAAGNLSKVEGSWRLISIDNGEKTIGFYREYTDISSLGFLVKYMLEKQPVLNTAISTSSALVYAKAMEKWVDGANKSQPAKTNP
ncbi:MAG: SRPBCC family protein, partial [Deltaproteobacteria bacterium]|nr:SRPBCC family protein [Deltaproteobacteria bacterium]